MFDLGQPWRIWHAIIFWNPHSVMFEVAWCVMLYTTRAGARVRADRARALPASSGARRFLHDAQHAARHRRRAALDAAPVVARLAVPDRAREAAPAVVLADAAGAVLRLGDRRRARHDHRRVAPERPRVRARARDGPARAAGARDGRGARGCSACCASQSLAHAGALRLDVRSPPTRRGCSWSSSGSASCCRSRCWSWPRIRTSPTGLVAGAIARGARLHHAPAQRERDRPRARERHALHAVLDGGRRCRSDWSRSDSRCSRWRCATCRSSPRARRPSRAAAPARGRARRRREVTRMKPGIGTLAILGSRLVTAVVIGVMSGIILRAHQGALIAQLTRSADQLSETIASSTYYDMLENRRDAVHREIVTIGRQQGIEKVRLFNGTGTIMFSSDEAEIGRAARQERRGLLRVPRRRAARSSGCRCTRAPRIYRAADGHRVLGMIRPIHNERELLDRRLPRARARRGGARRARREPVARRGRPPDRARPAPARSCSRCSRSRRAACCCGG